MDLFPICTALTIFTTVCTPVKALALPHIYRPFHFSKRDYNDTVPEGSVGSWYGNGTKAPTDASGPYSGGSGYNPPNTTTLVAVCTTIGSLAIIAVMGFLYMGYRIRQEKALAETMSSSRGSEPYEWKEGSQEGSQKEEGATPSGDSDSNEGKSSWIGRIGKMIRRGKDDTAGENGGPVVSEMGLKKPGPTSSSEG